MSKYLEQFVAKKIDDTNALTIAHTLPTVLADLILDHSLISPNKALKPLADRLGQTEYRDYLFQSRTGLLARLIKDIYVKTPQSTKTLRSIQQVVSDVLDSNKKKTKKTKHSKEIQKETDSPLKQWKRIIEQD
ncbi:MAG: hypothetical protein ABF743_11105 [Schleiferilactobacillus perolens]|jgi:hypothetical protein|uniref:hypothetical protein n=1 Tax=Schleiferilactobacillus perolens TaxID=100468 RepID=UPI0039EAD9FB